MAKVLIVVSGGVAYYEIEGAADVELIDLDNLDDTDSADALQTVPARFKALCDKMGLQDGADYALGPYDMLQSR